MKRFAAIVILCAILILGCWWFFGAEESEVVTPEKVSEKVDQLSDRPSELRKLIDRSGAEIEALDNYFRVVSYAPAITELLVDLGYGDRIVAITSYDKGDGVVGEPKVFDMVNPDMEGLLVLEPDLILVGELTAEGGADPLIEFRKMGTTVASFPTANTIADIYLDLEFMGELLGEKETADALVQDMKRQIAEISAITDKIEDKKSVYFEISPAPYMYSTGDETYLNQMISIAGGENVFADDQTSWISVTDEMVIAANPDVIITNVTYVDDAVEEIEKRNGWGDITAIKNGEVFLVENNPTSLPTRNILTGIREMAKDMYPELF